MVPQVGECQEYPQQTGKKSPLFLIFWYPLYEAKRRWHYIIHRLVKLPPPLQEEFLAVLYASKPISSIHRANEGIALTLQQEM